MATELDNSQSTSVGKQEREAVFAGIRRTLLLSLTALLAVCVVFSWRTRDAMEHLPFLPGVRQGSAATAAKSIVDLHTWQTVQALAPLAVSAEEREFARNAERLADHETDQSFATALRLAIPKKQAMSPRAQELTKRIADLQAAVAEDQRQVNAATPAVPKKTVGSREAIADAEDIEKSAAPVSDDLAVASAQMGLDQDELKDAREDLAHEIGDQRTRIQQELSAHEAAMQKYDAQAKDPGQIAVISSNRYGTLAGRLAAWQSQRSRRDLLEKAEVDARKSVEALTAQHDAIKGEADRTAKVAQSSDQSGAGLTGSARVTELKRRSAEQQVMSIFDDRIETLTQLAAVYGRWSDQVELQHRIVGHLLLQSFVEVIVILIAMILGGVLVRRWMDRSTLDRRRMQTLRTVVALGMQVLGAIAILLVVFGVPRQMPTILGLTTAGLTVVLQDFILAFFGWFVLMGKNGISVGDAVEIDGVSGDVVDIGLFRTTMLETGNWTAQGHPTGRRVAIINKFAINGQYFNFSTAGQFLWDEMTVPMGTQEDPYAKVKAIQEAVHTETDDESQLAMQEWQRSDRLHAAGKFSTEPEVNLRPSASGFDVLLRYVTRASERVETRNKLYGTVLGILHGTGAAELKVPEPAEAATKA